MGTPKHVKDLGGSESRTAEDEWQEIEAAPKDIQPILVFVLGSSEWPDMFHVAFRKRDDVFVKQDDGHSHVTPTLFRLLETPAKYRK